LSREFFFIVIVIVFAFLAAIPEGDLLLHLHPPLSTGRAVAPNDIVLETPRTAKGEVHAP
jgi:hypothetical protein